MEKVINEFRVIETDDGFRIEIKGDKERMKTLMRGFGRRRMWHGVDRRWHPGRGPFGLGMGPMMWMHAAPWFGHWEYGEEGEQQEQETDEA